MKVMVTGASGFIGNAVVLELLGRGISVTRMVRCPDARDLPGAETILADLTDYASIEDALGNRRFDVIVDTAAKIPTGTVEDEDYFDNIVMTRNLLRAAHRENTGYFVKLSTIDVYKIQNIISENCEIAPQNYYSLSKRMSEQYVEMWSKVTGTPACILRLPQIFGPGDRSHKFIPTILRKVRQAEKFVIFGDGLDRRDYLFVDDAGRMIADCCEKKISGVFNLASGRSYSLNEVVDMLRGICDKDFQVEHRARIKDRTDYEFDLRALRAVLGKTEMMPFPEALRRTLYGK